MSASRAGSGRSKLLVLTQSVNLRTRMKPRLPDPVADIAPQGEVEFFDCTSWLKLNTLDGNEADFGGDSQLRRVWGGGKAIEAVITLDAKAVDILEHDSDFLAFASPALSPYTNTSKI
ncbi:hypothetical protein Goarm_014714 [Gossypium armourianum]|uniref:Uncharacterized protein n=1 Tax=Gossypium armourianum TaxID=34283 RepID=A0A7J9J708_9ROSI|nr:hypothetical protein [Gossypium armourianum]